MFVKVLYKDFEHTQRLEEMHDPVLSQPIFVKAMSSQVRATSFVIWKIFVYVQMFVVTSATGTM